MLRHLLWLCLSLRREKVPGVDVNIVPEILLKAVVVVAAAAVLATVASSRRICELTPTDPLFADVEILGATFVSDLHTFKSAWGGFTKVFKLFFKDFVNFLNLCILVNL